MKIPKCYGTAVDENMRGKYSDQNKIKVNKKDIVAGLRCLGINTGDFVFFHSSLSSLGYVIDGAQTVVDAFLEAVGPSGTVAVHTCHFKSWHWSFVQSNPKPAFDVLNSPSLMGAITEVFRKQAGAVRCLDSSNPMCAIGPLAEYLSKDSLSSYTPCGRDTAWGKLGLLNAHYMFLGTGWSTCTLLHACEEYGWAPYTFMDQPSHLEVIDKNGDSHIHVQKVHTPNVPRNYANIEPEMQKLGLLRRGKIGEAECMVMSARDLTEVGTRCILENPAFLLRDPSFLQRCRSNQLGVISEQDQAISDT
jgi:aminoglycoside 3-N-acetyltransferase